MALSWVDIEGNRWVSHCDLGGPNTMPYEVFIRNRAWDELDGSLINLEELGELESDPTIKPNLLTYLLAYLGFHDIKRMVCSSYLLNPRTTADPEAHLHFSPLPQDIYDYLKAQEKLEVGPSACRLEIH